MVGNKAENSEHQVQDAGDDQCDLVGTTRNQHLDCVAMSLLFTLDLFVWLIFSRVQFTGSLIVS